MEDSSTLAHVKYIPLNMEENHITGPIKSQMQIVSCCMK